MTFSRSTFSRPASRLLLALTMVLGLLGGVATTSAPPAQAAGVSATVGVRAMQFAASKKGAPYQWGGVGPARFDCSGLTKWAYARAGRKLPRTAAQQFAATIRVSKANARRGDLVFFMSGGKAYHTGVYAGGAKVWHAPKTGDRVKLATIWTKAVTYGRVR